MTPTRPQVSSGGVVYRLQAQTIEIVLISVGEQERWQLPKGHVNKDETPEATALREVREETGCNANLGELIDKIEYWYYAQSRGQRVRFHKIVYFYLLEYLSGDTKDHDQEVNEARWVQIDQAQTMLTFKNERDVVSKAKERIVFR